MPPHGLGNVGDEPIYCETQHDDILYSGSEDDYYEAPEHRRLRIEAKAVQFLNGNLPYLLSAKLKGPFDAKSWNNPWRSKRAQCQATQPEAQSPHSMTNFEASKSHALDRVIDDLPDTQRTSLYPLPSPEITNPPSARKNPYMAEEEYNRIKTWRQTVKRVQVSPDPFWTSQQESSQRSTAASKRPAKQDWLHKRESKKHKSEDLRKLALEESPSQAASKTKRHQLSGRLAEIVTQSAPGSSTHEDELAPHWEPKTASFDTNRIANIPTCTPSVLHAAHKSLTPTRRSPIRDPESSEDELSMPSVTPSRNASRSPPKRSRSLNTNNTTGGRKRSDVSEASRIRGRIGETRQDMDAKIPLSQVSAQNKPRGLAKSSSRRAFVASQQDNSFHFHQARPRSRSPPRDPLPTDQMDGVTLSLSPSQYEGPATASEHLDREVDRSCAQGDDLCPLAPSDDLMDMDPSKDQESSPELAIKVATADDDAKIEGIAPNLETRVAQLQVTEAQPSVQSRPVGDTDAREQPQHERLQIRTNATAGVSTHACTQELSPVSMQDKPQTTGASTTTTEGPSTTNCLTVENIDTSNPEWSTYVDTQDPLTASERQTSFVECAQGVEFVSHGTNDLTDPDWTTYINTQDTTGPRVENGRASADVDEPPVVEQGPASTSNPDWSTFVDTRDQITAETQRDGVAVVEEGLRVAPEPSEYKVTELAAHDTESGSEWSSYSNDSSQDDIDHTCNTSNEPVLSEATALKSNSSQSIVGAIAAASADSVESNDEFQDCPESQLPIGDRQNTIATIQHGNDREAHLTEGGPQENKENTSPSVEDAEDAEDEPAIVTPMATIDQPQGTAEKSAFEYDGTTDSFESQVPSIEEAHLQSPWTKEDAGLSMAVVPSKDITFKESISRLSLLAGQALAFPPAPQTPWVGGRLPSPDFSLSVKKFADFMRPSPPKKRNPADGSILRSSGSTSRVLFDTPMPAERKRRVTFAPLPGEEKAVSAAADEITNEVYVEEDLSYFDGKGNKTASIRISRSQTRAASPPPLDVNIADADELPDHDHKFARHFEAMSKRKNDHPKKKERLLPSESQQTSCGQSIDAMAEAFIQASQTRKKSSELVKALAAKRRLSQSCCGEKSGPIVADSIDEQENIEPVDDVSAVLDNIDDFLDNSWGFNTSTDVVVQQEAAAQQQVERIPSRFANVGDPMLAMHANVWAE